MKSIREYEAMDVVGQESFLSHASVALVQKLYYENNRKGLEVVIKNLAVVLNRAQDCLDCLEMLNKEGDVFSKIYLLLEYMSKGEISEEFVSGLEEITERAQESLARATGVAPTKEEEREVLKRLNAVMNRNEIQANRSTSEMPDNPAKPVTPVRSANSAMSVTTTAVAGVAV